MHRGPCFPTSLLLFIDCGYRHGGTPMIAILSDIHGNLEALEAVLSDAAAFKVERIYCLGDLVGYGPDPIPCVERAMLWDIVLCGDFDDAAISGDDLAGWSALLAAKTVRRFRSELHVHPRRDAIAGFLSTLPTSVQTTEGFFVHGSPRRPLHEYVFPEDVHNPNKMEAIARHFECLCFCGHTHLPGVHHRQGTGWAFLSPADGKETFPISNRQLICNVGSVGQPRDGDRRASYVLLTPEAITFRRVEYDIEQTVQKIRDVGDDAFLGERLREGR